MARHTNLNSQKKIMLSLRVLLIFGMLLSLFLLYQHLNPETSSICNLGEGLNCDVVNKSPYANIDGIFYLMTFDFAWNTIYWNISNSHWFWDVITTNAFLGFLMLLFIFFLTLKMDKGLAWIKKGKTLCWLRGLLIASVAYGFILFLLQHFIIKSYCIYCLTLDVTMIASLILSYQLVVGKRNRKKRK